MDMTQLQEPVMSARADLVAIPEELHDVLVQIDNQVVDRRHVDFAALADRLQECIEKVQDLLHTAAKGEQDRAERLTGQDRVVRLLIVVGPFLT
jgi:hypothetical protein